MLDERMRSSTTVSQSKALVGVLGGKKASSLSIANVWDSGDVSKPRWTQGFERERVAISRIEWDKSGVGV
jgi:hypothetical protein